MDKNQDLVLIKQSLRAIRQRINEDLDALEAKVDCLLPDEKPRRRVPSTKAARKDFYRNILKET